MFIRNPNGAFLILSNFNLMVDKKNHENILFFDYMCISLNEYQDLFVAGTDTTSNTLEWAFAEVLRHPEKMTKAQAEIQQFLGKGQPRSIQESDVLKLPYVQAIVKETMRLHAPAPFLIPRKAIKNIDLCGYCVPKNAQVWINAVSYTHLTLPTNREV